MITQQLKRIQRFSFLVFLVVTTTFWSQQVRVTGQVSGMMTDGLHQLKIPHQVRSFAQQNLQDFRILDAKGNQVPYYLVTNNRESKISDFTPFEIVSNSKIKDTSTTLIFKNYKDKIQHVVLEIINYEGIKSYELQGSMDKKQWFGLVNTGTLLGLKSVVNTSVYKRIDFPLNSYRYLKIVFNDQKTLPINVLQIGQGTVKEIAAQNDEIPVLETISSEQKPEKKTLIQVRFKYPEVLNALHFDSIASGFYNRKVHLYTGTKKQVKGEMVLQKHRITSFSLRSDQASKFRIPNFFDKELYIEIVNEDNPPLSVASLRFLQTPVYAVADLKHTASYTIAAGDRNLMMPRYDLSYFNDKAISELPTATITNVTLLEQEEQATKAQESFWQQPWFMWLCIGFATILIVYFASSLVKDLKQ